jgi:hypothetical protein
VKVEMLDLSVGEKGDYVNECVYCVHSLSVR